jgi:N-methylhydantoinase A/oxoprolinase/acetone carboxylase beta subunit
MLVTDVHQERSLTRITPVDGAASAELDAIFADMEAAALQDLMQEQFPRERLQTRRHAGMRYRGQSYEVAVPVPRLRGAEDLADLVQRFTMRIGDATATWHRPGGRDRRIFR